MLLTKFHAGGKFLLLQEFWILFGLHFTIFSQTKTPKNPGNHSDFYKNWTFCSIWDICLWQWLQAITNQFFLFLILCWQITGKKKKILWSPYMSQSLILLNCKSFKVKFNIHNRKFFRYLLQAGARPRPRF